MPSSDTRMDPIGKGSPKARPIKGTFVEFGVAKMQRTRVTLAQLNAGLVLLPALPGVKWRLLDAKVIAIGGAVTTATAVRVTGVQAGSTVALLSVAVAALTQSAVVRAGAANATVLADGASFAANDANTAVRVDKTGSAATVATNVDVFLEYVAEAA